MTARNADAVPVMLHSSRSVSRSAPYPPAPSLAEALGTGMVIVMGLWNFLLRGSMVTIGLNLALLPRILFTRSGGMIWAWETKDRQLYLRETW